MVAGVPIDFWGKLRWDENQRVAEWHPLVDHCADVGAVAERLLGHSVLARRLGFLGGVAPLSKSRIARLAVLATFHDLGKFATGFQNKAYPGAKPRSGHVREALALFGDVPSRERENLLNSLPTPELESWAPEGGAFYLLLASISHHGRPYRLGMLHQATPWRAARGLDPFGGIAKLAMLVRRWFPEAFADDADPLPDSPAFQHAFSGLVMLADWIGSDTRLFPYSERPAENRMSFAREQSQLALRELHIDVAHDRVSLGPTPPDFSTFCSFTPTQMQRQVLDIPPETDGTLALLESETGSGKTEAAFARFLRLFHAGSVDGMYFALPTRSAATQIHGRLVDACRQAFPDPNRRPPVLLAVPGYLAVDEATGARILPDFDVLWNDDENDRFRYRGWAAENPKRYLAGAVVVGTIDQVLLSTLMVRHSHMRATSLLRHLLVVDEVHASDRYMTAILEAVLENHMASGGHALLMSATLGASARTSLLSAATDHQLATEDLATEIDRAYPQLVYSSASHVHVTAPGPSTKSKNVRRQLEPWAGDAAKVARLAVSAAGNGARVVVIRNTVSDCIETQLAVEAAAGEMGHEDILFRCGGCPAPHHSRYAKVDREQLDNALERSFGKRGSFEGCVVVATQTVQQSLDIDADLLVTDLCPADVLLQRIGRLHRHTRRRPTGFEEAVVVVLTPAERDLSTRIGRDGIASGDHGLGTVYDDLRVIEATWRQLEAHDVLEIPRMNRLLVESATHPAALAQIVSDAGGAWADHNSRVLGTTLAQKQLAGLNVVDRGVEFGEADFPSDGLERRIQTRLGEGDRIVELDAEIAGPFGAPVRRFAIPAHLARGIPADGSPSANPIAGGGVEFGFGTISFAYDRLGLRREDKGRALKGGS